MNPSFSIILPTYQRREVVCDAVRAICAIDYDGPVELIVVIDGSDDGTEEALAEIRCPFPTKLIYQDNTGLAGARNTGAANATGDILLFLDDDMICRPDIIEQHLRTHRSGADAVIGHIPVDPQSPDSFLTRAAGRWAEARARRLKSGAPLTLFDLIGGHMSVRRSAFESVGGFDASFNEGGLYGDEDLDFSARFAERFEIRFNPDAVSYHRYIVTPRQYLRQWHEAGQADVAFARKHPARAAELFRLHGGDSWIARLVLRPLAAIPLVPAALSSAAAWLASTEAAFPRAASPVIGGLFRYTRDLVYWAGVRKGGAKL